MGKYAHTKGSEKEEDLICIANELAEANRLKRWELLNNNWFEEDGRNRPIRSNKELEDKA